ncbi:sucrose transporter 2 [Medicago truncatula]|uniref:Sucrose transporter 2 n=1 Tax=Medicago truncatula TaxID=3880 RepID=G7JK86_MEDTR|nr:sucrose transporter 2 [Medicago truncatula]QMS54617.1 sugar transporter [Medicago truncatula]
MTAVASIEVGIQFGWAIHFDTLIPYIQEDLRVPHKWAANICVLGQILGLVVQPFIDYYSDRCRSSFGRCCPFILGGVIAVVITALLIAFATELGHLFGDTLESETKPHTIVILVLSLSMFDVVQVVGNILRYLMSSRFFGILLNDFYWTLRTAVYEEFCLDLKESTFISILFLIVLSIVALIYVEDVPLTEVQPDWVAWFPFSLFNIDWMGHEVYCGNPFLDERYYKGVRAELKGLMLKSIVLALMSFAVKPLRCYIGGPRRLWGVGNVIFVICLSMTEVIAKVAEHERHTHTKSSIHLFSTNDRYTEVPASDLRGDSPSSGIIAACYVFYTVIGVPLAVWFKKLFSSY